MTDITVSSGSSLPDVDCPVPDLLLFLSLTHVCVSMGECRPNEVQLLGSRKTNSPVGLHLLHLVWNKVSLFATLLLRLAGAGASVDTPDSTSH